MTPTEPEALALVLQELAAMARAADGTDLLAALDAGRALDP
jgi:hypothetical protein